jgi:hypothetical protein
MEVDRNGLHVLGRDACLRLMASASLGRIGITVHALPVILPVNYRLIGDEIVFRTGAGTKLDAAAANEVVAFEVDEVDPIYHGGWSVAVTGVARDVSDELAPDEVKQIPRWAPRGGGRVIAIRTDVVSGRRLAPAVAPYACLEP